MKNIVYVLLTSIIKFIATYIYVRFTEKNSAFKIQSMFDCINTIKYIDCNMNLAINLGNKLDRGFDIIVQSRIKDTYIVLYGSISLSEDLQDYEVKKSKKKDSD